MAKHTQTRQVASRLARIEGHVRAVRRMVLDDRRCADVLVQVAAIRSALDRAAKLLLADHMEHCILDACKGGGARKNLGELRRALERFIA